MNAEDAVRQMEEPELLSEVPPILKRFAKTVAYAFYEPELVVTISLLTNYPCVDEDTILEKLHFDKRQLRGVLSRLKNDKLVKQRQIKEKQQDSSNFNIYNFYFINYKLFVNVVKYKLDHIRRKLENEEQQARNRPSFVCLHCRKHYSDLEVDRLLDFETGMMRCSYCNGDVEEDANHINTQTNGSSLGRFNEQMESIFSLLRECEKINLAPEVLEPTPSTAAIKASANKSSSNNGNKSGWTSKASRDLYDQNIQINVREEVDANKEAKKSKVVPVWMSESTVLNEESNDSVSSIGSVLTRSDTPVIPETIEEPVASIVNKDVEEDDIMSHLLAHESKEPRLDKDSGLGNKPSKEESSSDSEIIPSPEQKVAQIPTASEGVAEIDHMMESEEEDENEMMVKVGDKQYALADINDEIIEKMSPGEHDAYLKMYSEAYEDYY